MRQRSSAYSRFPHANAMEWTNTVTIFEGMPLMSTNIQVWRLQQRTFGVLMASEQGWQVEA